MEGVGAERAPSEIACLRRQSDKFHTRNLSYIAVKMLFEIIAEDN